MSHPELLKVMWEFCGKFHKYRAFLLAVCFELVKLFYFMRKGKTKAATKTKRKNLVDASKQFLFKAFEINLV